MALLTTGARTRQSCMRTLPLKEGSARRGLHGKLPEPTLESHYTDVARSPYLTRISSAQFLPVVRITANHTSVMMWSCWYMAVCGLNFFVTSSDRHAMSRMIPQRMKSRIAAQSAVFCGHVGSGSAITPPCCAVVRLSKLAHPC